MLVNSALTASAARLPKEMLLLQHLSLESMQCLFSITGISGLLNVHGDVTSMLTLQRPFVCNGYVYSEMLHNVFSPPHPPAGPKEAVFKRFFFVLKN